MGPRNFGLGGLTGRSNEIDINVDQIEIKQGSNTDRMTKEDCLTGGDSLKSARATHDHMSHSVKVDNFIGLLDNALDIIQMRDSLDISG